MMHKVISDNICKSTKDQNYKMYKVDIFFILVYHGKVFLFFETCERG